MGQMGTNISRKSCLFAVILIFYWTVDCVRAWDAEDFEVFDLVEEVGKNFYEVLGVSKDASQSAIRKAYHRLSLQLHPDHNKDDNAEQIFRQLVGVYEVLKDEAKRQKYDQVLTDGLPDWRQPIFYYRRVRKFGLAELAIILFGILTLGQYIVAWSVYLERKYEVEEVIGSKLKKKDKKLKKGRSAADMDDPVKSRLQEEICQIPKPRCRDLLPFLIIRGLVFSVCSVPSICVSLCAHYKDIRARRLQAAAEALAKAEAAAAASDHSDDGETEERQTKSRRRRVYEIPEYTPSDNSASPEVGDDDDDGVGEVQKIVYENRVWFDDDIAALTRAMVKYPVGTVERWDVIAELLQRPRDDVITMAKTVNKLSAGVKPVSDSIQGMSASTVDINGQPTEQEEEEADDDEDSSEGAAATWSSVQQKALEVALSAFPKGVPDRWDKIGSCVPDRTKEECIVRYKYLVELVKKRRQKDDR